MALKKNEFLDASDSEDEGVQDYDSDDDLKKGGRVAKRRKVDESDDDASDVDAADDAQSDGKAEQDDDDDADQLEDEDIDDKKGKSKSQDKLKGDLDIPEFTGTRKKNLVVTEKAIKKSGVVYLSRIPPFMKPQKLRSLLEPYGKINRTFLAPEDPVAHARRVKAGGNKKRMFTEGWVEFVNKKDAKLVVDLLNTRIIGGKKGNYYHDDIWNMLYLNGFKWHNLTEQITAENAERESRMRAEISKSTKENKDFLKNVERAKMLDGMEAKAKAKKRKAGPAEDEAPKKGPRTFKQAQLANKGRDEDQPEAVNRVLSKIF